MNTKRIAADACIIAMALAAHFVEGLFPPLFVGIPVRLGLANVFTLFALARMRRTDAFIIVILRCFMGAVLGGSIVSAMYSVAGGALSFAAMLLLMRPYRKDCVSLVGVSVLGAFAFNVGQLCVGAMFLSASVIVYLPWVTALSVPTGVFVGLLAQVAVRRVP